MEEIRPEYNLLDEKWIKVLTPDYTVREVSVYDALCHAQDFMSLAGESRSQDVAVMRLLLAILHTIVSRTDENGENMPIESQEDAVLRWKEIWAQGGFSDQAVHEYLEQYRDRFYLFHPRYPFYQVPEAVKGTEYSAAKLNGEISESNHKLRLFSVRTGKDKTTVSYDEAARWLLYINGYDDTAGKATDTKKPKKDKEKLPSPGVGWLGKLGLVTAVGENLFETLMLNMPLLKDGEELWNACKPAWELEEPRSGERIELKSAPDNPAELLTLQSRRILLKRENNQVTGYYLLGGDFFSIENAFAEQMTIWRKVEAKGGGISYQPRRHDSTRLLWRDFASLVSQKNDCHIPGIISWISVLKEENILPEEQALCLQISSVQYGFRNFFISDEFSDSMTFSAELLSDSNAGEKWRDLVIEEIERCEKRAWCVGVLAQNLEKASGGGKKEQDVMYGQARERFFSRSDIPFRKWLRSLKVEDNIRVRDEKRKEWTDQVRAIALDLGSQLVKEAGPAALAGRNVVEKQKRKKGAGQSVHYCAPESFNRFIYQINKIETE